VILEVAHVPEGHDEKVEELLRERYQVSFRQPSPNSDPKMANKVLGHECGYNEVAEQEIKRRFGKKALRTIWDLYYGIESVR